MFNVCEILICDHLALKKFEGLIKALPALQNRINCFFYLVSAATRSQPQINMIFILAFLRNYLIWLHQKFMHPFWEKQKTNRSLLKTSTVSNKPFKYMERILLGVSVIQKGNKKYLMFFLFFFWKSESILRKILFIHLTIDIKSHSSGIKY